MCAMLPWSLGYGEAVALISEARALLGVSTWIVTFETWSVIPCQLLSFCHSSSGVQFHRHDIARNIVSVTTRSKKVAAIALLAYSRFIQQHADAWSSIVWFVRNEARIQVCDERTLSKRNGIVAVLVAFLMEHSQLPTCHQGFATNRLCCKNAKPPIWNALDVD